jgi:Zn-dependent protease with chaperone function
VAAADATRPRRSHREPLWDRIDRNRLKAGAFVAAFIGAAAVSAGLLVALGGVFLGVVLVSPGGTDEFFGVLPWLIVGALAGGGVLAAVHVVRMLTHPERRLPALFGATRSDTGTMLETKSALHDMAIAAGFAHSPGLWVIEDCERVNAFALGLSAQGALVGVTRGFADRLSVDDQRAVFANLMARVRAADTMSATVIAAIMGPIWSNRAAELRKQEARDQDEPNAVTAALATGDQRGSAAVVGGFLLSFLAVILTELIMAGHERAALAVSEKADAEGMLLLKDPRAMLDALQHVLDANNTVPGAGEAYSMLFYCWAGFGYAPEDDPEMQRLGRLREVLGAEGATP